MSRNLFIFGLFVMAAAAFLPAEQQRSATADISPLYEGADGDTPEQPTAQTDTHPKEYPQEVPMTDTSEVMPQTFLASIPAPKHSTEAEDEQDDLISVDSVFGVESRKNPLEEYTALNEKLKRECDAVFEMIENQH